MSRQVFIFDDRDVATTAVGEWILQWAASHQGQALGGATGRSPIDVWAYIWQQLTGPRQEERADFVNRPVVFLDEYFGAYPAYYHWACRNLRVNQGGFSQQQIFTPRGSFFEFDRIVDTLRLDEILNEHQDQWVPMTEPGEDGEPPEVRLCANVEHPVLRRIQQTLDDYDGLVRQHQKRLQLLGIGVGGAIQMDPRAGGHIGFVEYGAADPESKTMLVRMASSTLAANAADFQLTNEDGAVQLQPSGFAITQGISTILSASDVLLMAWGHGKSEAVQRMLFGQASPYNPAAWLQSHEQVAVFLDRAAAGSLDSGKLADHGWELGSVDSLQVQA